MRTLIVVGFVLSLVATFASAGSITVTTTAEQDAALAEMAKQQRPAHPPRVPGAPMTPQQVVQSLVDRATAGPVARMKRDAACAKITDPASKVAFNCPAASKAK